MSTGGELTKRQKIALGITSGVTAAGIAALIYNRKSGTEEQEVTKIAIAKAKYLHYIGKIITDYDINPEFRDSVEAEIKGDYQKVLHTLEALDSKNVKVKSTDIRDVPMIVGFLTKFDKPIPEEKKCFVAGLFAVRINKIMQDDTFVQEIINYANPIPGLDELYQKKIVSILAKWDPEKGSDFKIDPNLAINYWLSHIIDEIDKPKNFVRISMIGQANIHMLVYFAHEHAENCDSQAVAEIAAELVVLEYLLKNKQIFGQLKPINIDENKISPKSKEFLKAKYKKLQEKASVATGGELTKPQRIALGIASGVAVAGILPVLYVYDKSVKQSELERKQEYEQLIRNFINGDESKFKNELETAFGNSYEDLIPIFRSFRSFNIRVENDDIKDISGFVEFLKRYQMCKLDEPTISFMIGDLCVRLKRLINEKFMETFNINKVDQKLADRFEIVTEELESLYRIKIDEFYKGKEPESETANLDQNLTNLYEVSKFLPGIFEEFKIRMIYNMNIPSFNKIVFEYASHLGKRHELLINNFIIAEYKIDNNLDKYTVDNLIKANRKRTKDLENLPIKTFLNKKCDELMFRLLQLFSTEELLQEIISDYNAPENKEFKSRLDAELAEFKVDDPRPVLRALKFWDLSVESKVVNDVKRFVEFLRHSPKPQSELSYKKVAAVSAIMFSNYFGVVFENDDFMECLPKWLAGPTPNPEFELYALNDAYLKAILELSNNMKYGVSAYQDAIKDYNLMTKYRILKMLRSIKDLKLNDSKSLSFAYNVVELAKTCTDSESYELALKAVKLVHGKQGDVKKIASELNDYLAKYPNDECNTGFERLLRYINSSTGGSDFGFDLKFVIFLIILLLFLFIVYRVCSMVCSQPDPEKSN